MPRKKQGVSGWHTGAQNGVGKGDAVTLVEFNDAEIQLPAPVHIHQRENHERGPGEGEAIPNQRLPIQPAREKRRPPQLQAGKDGNKHSDRPSEDA